MTADPAQKKLPVLQSVQGLRALAALLVVLMHMQLPRNGIDIFAHPVLAIFRDFGHFGVDLFFAISGFIMLVTNWEWFSRPGASLRFLMHRAIRIYPAYWLSILPIFFAFLFARQRLMSGHMTGKTDLLASFLLYPQPVEHVLLPVSWTLVFELTFYVIFSAILLMRRRYLMPALGVWFCAQLALWFAFDGSSNAYLKYAATALPIEFIFGILVGIAYVRARMPQARAVLALGVLAALAVWGSCLYLQHPPFATSMGRVIMFGIPAALVLYGVVAYETAGFVRVPLWIVTVGNASYAMYLWHFPLIGAMRQIVLRLHPAGLAAELAVIASALGVILLVSLAVYRFFEKPVTKALNTLAAGRERSRTLAPARRFVPASVQAVED